MLKLGWFSTGRGKGSRALLNLIQEEITDGNLEAEIQFVFQNRERGESEESDTFQDLVNSYNIPLLTLSSQGFRTEHGVKRFSDIRLEFDQHVLKKLEAYKPDICVLAGYMLILGPELNREFTAINLHPALPGGPTGTWQQVIWKLIENRSYETGAMIHLVTDKLDLGPTITYFSFPIQGPFMELLWEQAYKHDISTLRINKGEELPLFQYIRKEGEKREPFLLLETIRAFSKGTIQLANGRILNNQGIEAPSQSLNNEIESKIRNL